ncbi:MAG: purine-binding chemotaxis protein CheW [Bacteroidetes bacterium]|nr:purine-binding chemotaxis protein CheW [Bacteroidota bacterium]
MNNFKKLTTNNIVLFRLDELQYALYLSTIKKVIHSIKITFLPNAPKKILGVINLHGEIIPVINIRFIFGLPTREINLEDQFIIAKTSKRLIALAVDFVENVTEIANYKIIDTKKTLPFTNYLSGITVIKNNIVLINDLEKFLSLKEQQELDKSLNVNM